MARNKNALRGHFVQAYVPGNETPGDEWLELAKWITTIGDDTQEESEDQAYYDGDGTPETEITSVAGAYTPEGTFDPEDAAQALIASLKYKTGVGRKVWHKVVSADGKKEWVGRATVSDIVAGAGDASAYEEFGCNIRFDQLPTESALPKPGSGIVEFIVTDGDDEPVVGVDIKINEEDLTTDVEGKATIELVEGTYPYTVNYPFGYTGDASGSVTVIAGETITEAIQAEEDLG